MPNTLRFYQNFTPNLGRGEHYYFDDIDDYFTAISSHLFGYIETVDNYRITSLVLRLPYPIQYDEQTGDFAHFENITYIAEYDERIQLWRFYHVKSFTYLSNYIEFNLSRDLWADFIAKASLEHIFVQRCNRLPNGVYCGHYDPVTNTRTDALLTDNDYHNFSSLKNDPTLDDVWVVFVCIYEVYKDPSWFSGNITASAVQVYGVKPSTYIPSGNKDEYIEKTIAAISRIYAVEAGQTDNDAYACLAYIVPQDFIPIRTPAVNHFYSSGNADFWNDSQEQGNLYAIDPSYINIRFDIEQRENAVRYFGTPSAMLLLPSSFDENGYISPTIECIVKKDDIQIIARCGDSQLDISKSFSVGLPNANGPASPEQQIARGVSTIGSLVGAATNFAAGNIVGAGLGVATALLPKDTKSNAEYKNNGDGLSTWKKWKVSVDPTTDPNIRYPIGITQYPSMDTYKEANYVKYNGGIINAFVSSIHNCIIGRALTLGLQASRAYIKATIDVENAPLDACDYIANEFANGLEIVEL